MTAAEFLLTQFPGTIVLREWVLAGGISAQMTGLELSNGHQFVVRTPSDVMHQLVPGITELEYRRAKILAGAGLPVPRAIGLDPDHRWLILEMIDGAVDLHPADLTDFATQMGHALGRIHQTPITDAVREIAPVRRLVLKPQTEFASGAREEELYNLLQPREVPDSEPIVLWHGDYWPGNILWRDGQIQAVIDWEMCHLGPAIADLAISRLDMHLLFGSAARETYTAAYLAAHPIPIEHLAYWDLRACLRAAGEIHRWAAPMLELGREDLTTGELIRRHHLAVDDALSRFAGNS